MNNALEFDCVKYGYNFIENSYILPEHLWQDDLQLETVNHFSIILNRDYFLSKSFIQKNIKNLSSEGEESVLSDEERFIALSEIISNSFNSTDLNDILDAKIGLREMRIQCPEKIIVGHLNMNSIRKKFDAFFHH